MSTKTSHCIREPLLRESFARQSLTSRISTRVARSLSVIGVSEEPRNGSVAGASINTLCNVVGAGVLSLPLAMYEASIAGAIVLMIFTALLAGFASFAIIAGCDMTQRFSFTEVLAFSMFPPMSFEEFCTLESSLPHAEHLDVEKGTMEIANLRKRHAANEIKHRKYRRIMTVLVELIVFLSNYGTLVIYSRVIADSIPPVVENFLHGSGLVIQRYFWLGVSGIIFFFLSCVRNMDELKWTSLIGFLTIFYIVVAVTARYFTSIGNSHYPNVDPKHRGEINWYHIGTGIFRTMSTYGVAFDYHYNIPYFYKELRDRTSSNMMKSVYISFPIIVACYIATGVFGYLTFGDLVTSKASGGDIVRNYPNSDPVFNVGRLGLFFHFACVYPILSVGARRGLHRLIMNGLITCSQTERSEVERQPGEVTYDGRESAEAHTIESALDPNLDRDVGSPEDTTRLAIVIEAFFIVGTTVLLAAVIPGISMVIDFVGALFGTFLMLTCPGLVAWFIFSRHTLVGTSPYPFARLLMGLAVLLVFLGVALTVLGLVFVIQKYAS